jgi:hypothetical protein
MIRLIPPAFPGSALPGRVQVDGRSATPRDRLAPELAGRVTLPPPRNTHEADEPAPSRVPAKAETAGCG